MRIAHHHRKAPVGLAAAVLAAAALLLGPTTTVSTAAATPGTAATSTLRCPVATSLLRTTRTTAPRTVALTFDDGPSATTPAILDTLKRHKVRATFFVVGREAEKYPQILKRIADEGHVIGNHTWSHPQRAAYSKPYGSFDRLSSAVQRSQLDTTTAIIRKVTGKQPCYFRGPGGHHTSRTTKALTQARRMSIVHWTISTEDWRQPAGPSTSWARRITARAKTTHRHPIILMHDGPSGQDGSSRRTNTAAALPGIIKHYQARGYVFTDPKGNRIR